MSATTLQKRPWWQPGVFEYSGIELFVMRALFAVLVFTMIKWETSPYTAQEYPKGIAHLVDLTWLGHHPPGMIAKGITIAGLTMYALGCLPLLGLAPALFYAVCIGTLITSQSKNVNHTWQLVTLMLLAQFIIYAWRFRKSELLRPDLAVHRLAAHASTVVIAASYVVSGVVKLVNSDFLWIKKVPLLSLQLLKSNWAGYYDTLERPPEWLERATQLVVDYPNLARLFFGTGLLIELVAFVVLINRRWAFIGGLTIILLHLSISQVMRLDFEYHIAAAFIFLVNVPGFARMRRGEP